jgi:hypothetical protein
LALPQPDDIFKDFVCLSLECELKVEAKGARCWVGPFTGEVLASGNRLELPPYSLKVLKTKS